MTETDSFNIMKYEYIYNGAGVGIADLNNDGLQDISICRKPGFSACISESWVTSNSKILLQISRPYK